MKPQNKAEPLLTVKNITKQYPISSDIWWQRAQTFQALTNISFSLNEGETVAIVGESGSGKSTLARLVTQIEKPTTGDIIFKGKNFSHVQKKERLDIQKAITMVFQDPYRSLNPRKTVKQILEESLIINTSMTKSERKDKVIAILEKTGLKADYLNRYPHMFSGGQRQRIAIARSLMLSPSIVVADEPVSALDVSVQAQILNLFMDLKQEMGLSYLFISHDLSVVKHIADRVAVIYRGEIVEMGSVDEIFHQPQHSYTQKLLSATPSIKQALPRSAIEKNSQS